MGRLFFTKNSWFLKPEMGPKALYRKNSPHCNNAKLKELRIALYSTFLSRLKDAIIDTCGLQAVIIGLDSPSVSLST